ncbi:2-dehydro-3-deoxyphosphooctonate aldolase 1 [Citrus sinensis]|uniref:2-dehydro-3-deoxyphosphooctonate aldolase 1 n=1 Tax=Citrus sinensis TaxID=2711 RepID=A0ACB8HQI5_CITSI|nr:2-dehydro-3-deoxyphosphooctonate aldolase 1 [Citrus sinensis]
MDPSTALFNQLKAAEPFFLLAGPNVIESEEHIMRMAKHIKSISTKVGLPLVFKSSFDKANRTSSKSFRGPGMVEGLKILEKVKIAYDIPIVTDVHETVQCEEVGKVADIIQIPAFLCRQTDLLVAAAKTGKIINIKKGQFCASSVMVNSAEKVRLAGNPNVMRVSIFCWTGVTISLWLVDDLIVDPRNLEWMREANCPVVADVTHSLQQPAGKKLDGGGVASGGLRELIPCIARTAIAVGVDGVFMEVHDDPLNAPVDGPTQWPLRNLEELLEELVAIAEKLMLKKLKFRLNVPTPYVFMLRFLKAAQSDTKLEHLAFYLIELSLVQYEALKFKPSLLCASAIYVARCTLQMRYTSYIRC